MRIVRVLLVWAAVLMGSVLSSPSAQAGEDAGCARAVLSPYLAVLTGWHIAAFQATDAGVDLVMEQEGDPRFLLLNLALQGQTLYTFSSVHGTGEGVTLPPDLASLLTAQWDRLWQDPAAQQCKLLNVSEAPNGDEAYKRLEVLYRGLQPDSGEAGGAWSESELQGLWALIAAIVAVFAVGVVLAILIRRRRRRSAMLADSNPANADPTPSDPADHHPSTGT